MNLYLSRLAISSALVAGTALIGAQPAGADGGLASEPCTNASPDPSWHQEFPATSPPPTRGGAMAYDSASGQTILFGGVTFPLNTTLDDTWAWDGTTWTELDPATAPSVRFETAMAYDSGRDEIVLFGGEHGGSRYQDTWVFQDGEWTERHPATSPPGLDQHVMAYDPLRHEVVLYDRGQTWTWDGTNWTERHPTKSPLTTSPGAAYDAARRGVVLFGGYTSEGTTHDTWVWDGTTWERIHLHPRPGPRSSFAMARFGRDVVLFGGSRTDHSYRDTWLLGPCSWTKVRSLESPGPRVESMSAWDSARHEMVLFGGYDGAELAETWTLSS